MERLINTTEEYIDNLENSPAIGMWIPKISTDVREWYWLLLFLFLICIISALIGSKVGILSLLDDESKLQQPSAEQFTLKVYNTWESNDVLTQTPKRVKFEGFTIRHFVTNVHYETVSSFDYLESALIFSMFV